MSSLTYRERRMLLYDGIPARQVAVAERMPVNEVLELRSQLRGRGVLPSYPGVDDDAQADEEQLDFTELDRLMTDNHTPREQPR